MRTPLPRPVKPASGWDLHHVYGGANRKHSEKWNAVVYLPHCEHLYGTRSPHENAEVARAMHEAFQRRFEESGWTRGEFMETFGRSYL